MHCLTCGDRSRERKTEYSYQSRTEEEDKMLTLDKFEEASEIVKQVTQETKLIYSDYFSKSTGNKVYFKPEICRGQVLIS